jgi:hypothetical protein
MERFFKNQVMVLSRNRYPVNAPSGAKTIPNLTEQSKEAVLAFT